MDINLSSWVDRHADFSPDKTAIHFEGDDLSYAGLADQVGRLAAVLSVRLEVTHGDRVAFLGQNSPHALALLFACARVGAIFVPLNWRLAPPEHLRMLGDCGPKALFVEPVFQQHIESIRDQVSVASFVALDFSGEGWLEFADLLDQADPAAATASGCYSDPALICYTSGATGLPKGVVLTQNALLFNAINSIHMHDLSQADRVLTTIPLFHVGGLNIQTLPALHLGATVVLQRVFDPAATFDDVINQDITLTVLVPAQMQAMVSHDKWATADLSSLRAVTTGSTFVPHRFIQAFHDRDVPVLQIYGATETAPLAIYTTLRDAAKVGSTGKPALHCDVRLIDDDGDDIAVGQSGEILVRGPSVMQEYWHQPEITAKALQGGWYFSGDVGHIDDAGYYYVDDRKKDMIISGGENIYPAELENVLADCMDVAEAAVVGRKDEKWGEVAVAIVVPKQDIAIAADDVLKLFDGTVARYKHPKEVVFTDNLPRNAMGKILKDELRVFVEQQAAV